MNIIYSLKKNNPYDIYTFIWLWCAKQLLDKSNKDVIIAIWGSGTYQKRQLLYYPTTLFWTNIITCDAIETPNYELQRILGVYIIDISFDYII